MSAVPVPNGRRGYVARHVGDLFATPVAAVETPAARSTDPETSHIAAAEVTKSGLRGHQQRQVAAALIQWPGRTTNELAALMCACRFMVARRMKEVETAGHAVRGGKRQCRISLRMAEEWFPKGETR